MPTADTAAVETEAVISNCSFCLKPSSVVEKLIGGPGVYICIECVALCDEILADASPHDRVAPWDREQSLAGVLALLPKVAAAGRQVEENLAKWVQRARELGATWAQIGETLGMARQSAWERFSGEE